MIEIDLSRFRCTCLKMYISLGDVKIADALGITPEEAHILSDLQEEILDQVVAEGW